MENQLRFFLYDIRGNLLSETRTIGTVAHAVGYAYDAADRLVTMTHPSGRIVTYVRDGHGRITGVTTKASATAAAVTLASNIVWQPNVAGGAGGEHVFGQGNLGTAVQAMALPGDAGLSGGGSGGPDLLQSLTYGNGLVLWKNFSLDNELYQLIVEQSPSVPSGVRINRYVNRADNTFISGIVDGVTAGNTQSFTYTDAGRLSGASSGAGSYGTRAWTYDANGNRLSETANGTLNSYTYPAANNRLTNVKQGATTLRAFTYDAAGNMTRDTRGATQYNYTINHAGRIRTFLLGTALRSTYSHDGFQRLRVKAQTTPAATTHYVWDSFGHIIAEHASAGAVQKEYVWLGDTPLAVIAGASLHYVHPDHLDRPVMMTTATQAIAWAATYDPFGTAVTVTAAPVNNQRLPGQWFQLEDGLAYNWHRTYDASLGRYTQPDPLGFVDGPNQYAYAGGNPASRVDSDGRKTIGFGLFGEITPGVGIGGGFGIQIDFPWNDCTPWDLKFFGSFSGRLGLAGAFGGSISLLETNNAPPSIFDGQLEGDLSGYLGGFGGTLVSPIGKGGEGTLDFGRGKGNANIEVLTYKGRYAKFGVGSGMSGGLGATGYISGRGIVHWLRDG